MSQASLAAKMPWTDHAGQFSPGKTVMLVALCLPFLWVVYLAATDGLGNRPVTEAIHQTGDWAVRILLLSLLITPLRRLARWSDLLAVRRMVGVAAFAYAFMHFCLYILDQKFALWRVATEIALRVYLTVGFVTVLGLAALAITSTDDWQRRLGRRWQKLHNIVYSLAALGIAHFFMQSKVNVSEPLLVAGLFIWAMAWRRWGKNATPAELFALAFGVFVVTAIGEAAWYGLVSGIDPFRVITATLRPEVMLRPAWKVLFVCLGFAAVAWIRRRPT